MHCVVKVISGGQTGVDQGALWAAKIAGIATGGWMPHGYRTERGPHPELAAQFGLKEHVHSSYPSRTRANVQDSDGTLIFGDDGSPGCLLTKQLCEKYGKPWRAVAWDSDRGFPDDWNNPEARIGYVTLWLERHQIVVLNVAGNRESTAPGITIACRNFLVSVLNNVAKENGE